MIGHKPSLRPREVPHKIWAWSVQPFWRLLDTNKQTPTMDKLNLYIDVICVCFFDSMSDQWSWTPELKTLELESWAGSINLDIYYSKVFSSGPIWIWELGRNTGMFKAWFKNGKNLVPKLGFYKSTADIIFSSIINKTTLFLINEFYRNG